MCISGGKVGWEGLAGSSSGGRKTGCTGIPGGGDEGRCIVDVRGFLCLLLKKISTSPL